MEPRADKIRKARTEKRQKLFRAFSASTALSSMILGGAQLASPTYAKYSDANEQEVGVEACFIFPGVIEADYRDKAGEISKKAMEDIQQVMEEGKALKGSSALKISLESFDDNDADADDSSEADSFSSSGGTRVEALESRLNRLESSLSRNTNKLDALLSKISRTESALDEVEEFQAEIDVFVNQTYPEAEKQGDEKHSEVLNLLKEIGDIQDRAVAECTYETDYFEKEILPPMEEAESGLKETLTALSEGKADFEKMYDETEEKLQKLGNMLQKFSGRKDSLESKIDQLKEQIRETAQNLAEARAEEARKAKEKKEQEQKEKEQIEKEKKEKEEKEKEKEKEQGTKPDGKKEEGKSDGSAGDASEEKTESDKPADSPKEGAGSDAPAETPESKPEEAPAGQGEDSGKDSSPAPAEGEGGN